MSAALTPALGLTLPAPAQAHAGAGDAYAQAWNGGLHQRWNHDG